MWAVARMIVRSAAPTGSSRSRVLAAKNPAKPPPTTTTDGRDEIAALIGPASEDVAARSMPQPGQRLLDRLHHRHPGRLRRPPDHARREAEPTGRGQLRLGQMAARVLGDDAVPRVLALLCLFVVLGVRSVFV